MKKVYSTIFLTFFYYSYIYSQKIEGRVVNRNDQPIEFANISLLSSIDSSFVQGTNSDAHGRFLLNVSHQEYILKISFVGYLTLYKPCEPANLGNIALSETSQELNEVTIKANKPLINYKGNKLIYNVKNMTNIQGLKAVDILEYVPRLSVSPTDGIKVGNTSATIYVNDRKLSQNEANAYLQNLNADEISTIEIQNMRGIEHAADVQGGVISIQTKGIIIGTSGSVQLYADTPKAHYYSFNPNTNLYWGTKKWNIYGSYSYEQGKMLQHSETTNDFLTEEIIHFSSSDNIGYTGNHAYKIGSMIELNKKHLLMLEFNGNHSDPYKDDTDYSLINLYTKNSNISDKGVSYSKYINNSNYYNMAVSYKWSIDTKGSYLKLLANYNYKEANNKYHINTTYDSNSTNDIDETDKTISDANSYSIQGNFMKNFASDWSFFAGGSIIRSNRKSDLSVTSNQDVPISTFWKYNENIAAGYIGLSKQVGQKYYYYLSMRAENTDIKGNSSQKLNERIKKNYTNWIPYIYLSYTPNKKTAYAIAYTRTLFRPPFALMNNYTNRISDVLYDKGNPDLKGAITDIIQLQGVYKSHSIVISYRHTSDEITEFFEAKDGITYHTNLNYGSVDNVSCGYYFSNKITPWWQTNIGISGNYKYISKSYNVSHLWEADVTMSNRFFISKIGDINLNIKGYTDKIAGNAYRKGYATVNIGYSRLFLNKKLNLRCGVNDIFNGVKNRSHTYVPSLDYRFYSKNQTRKVWLSLSYNFSTKNEVNKNQLRNDNSIKNRL